MVEIWLSRFGAGRSGTAGSRPGRMDSGPDSTAKVGPRQSVGPGPVGQADSLRAEIQLTGRDPGPRITGGFRPIPCFDSRLGATSPMIRTAFGLLALLILSNSAPAAEPARPNILLIVADDLGFSDPGCYGGEIATPNLDALAKNGLRFTQFYNTARCWPTRAAILTGYYAQQVRRDSVPGVPSGAQGTRPAWARLLPEMLRPLGYRSYHSGKWHIDGEPVRNGFDHSYSLNDHYRHFTPLQHTEDGKALPAVAKDAGYYSTTAIADHAIK